MQSKAHTPEQYLNELPDDRKVGVRKLRDVIAQNIPDGFEEGMDIPIFYDPMIGKLCVWDTDRATAIDKMIEAIDAFQISGVTTTLNFGKFVMKHEAFCSGKFDTNFVPHHFTDPKLLEEAQTEELFALGASLDKVWDHMKELANKKAATERVH